MHTDGFDIEVFGAEKVSGIRIFVGESSVNFFQVFLDSVSVCTKYGKKHSVGHCGRKEGEEITINFSDAEYLTGIFGTKKLNILTSVGVSTNMRKIGPFGVCVGTEFEIDHNLPVAKISVTARYDRGIESIIVYCSKAYNPETARFNYFFEIGDYRNTFKHLNSHRKAENSNETYQIHVSNDIDLWSALLFTKVSTDISECARLYVALSGHPALQAEQKRKGLTIASYFEADPDLRTTLLSKFESLIRSFQILHVKVTHNDVSRRIQFSNYSSYDSESHLSPGEENEFLGEELRNELHPKLTYETLRDSIAHLFPNVECTIEYRDDEGDLITVNSDEELKEAVRIMVNACAVENQTIHFRIIGDTIQPQRLSTLLESSETAAAEEEEEEDKEEVEIVNSHVDEIPQTFEKAVVTYRDEEMHRASEDLLQEETAAAVTLTEAAEMEPVVTIIETGDRDFDLTFVSHNTFSLGSEVQPGSVLCKVWTVKNSGTKAWLAGSALALVGDEGSAAEYKSAGLLKPVDAGEVAEVSIYIKAAEEAGPFDKAFRMTLPGSHGPGPFGEELSLQLQVLNAEDDWDVIMRNEDEVADSMLHTKCLADTEGALENGDEEELFPNLTLSKVLRAPSELQGSEELVPPSEADSPSLDKSQPMVAVRSDLEEAELQSQEPVFSPSQSARTEELQMLFNMGFDDVSMLEALLQEHVNPSLQRVDTDAIQRIIGMLLSQQVAVEDD